MPVVLIVGIVIIVLLFVFYLWATFFHPEIIAQSLVWVYFVLWLVLQSLLITFYVWLVKGMMTVSQRFKPTMDKVWKWAENVFKNV